MALKQVKEYYRQVEKLYLDLNSELKELEGDFKEGNITEEQLNNLLTPVNNIKDNYLRLSYFLHLLFAPNRKSKLKNYERQNKELAKVFEDNGVTAEKDIERDEDALKVFKKNIEEFKKNGQKED